MLHKFADKVDQNIDELATLESTDVGKPLSESLTFAAFGSMVLRYYAGLANQIEGKAIARDSLPGHSFAMTRKESVGVCAGILPWNFPMGLSFWKVAPMLVMYT